MHEAAGNDVRPEHLQQRRVEAPDSPEVEQRRGFSALHTHKREYMRGVEYRFSNGRCGDPPLAHLHERRTAPVREHVARKANGASGAGQIPKTTGAALPSSVQARLAPLLGPSVQAARIHTGAESAAAARDFGARAFTVGTDVHFGAGEYRPGTKDGDQLLAHELTHVVQGQNAGVQRKEIDSSAPGAAGAQGDSHEVSQPGEPAEKEADAVADRVGDVLHGSGTEGKGGSAAGPSPTENTPKVAAKPEAGVQRKIFLAKDGPTATHPSTPPPVPVFDVGQIARATNIRVGNLLDTPGPGHAVLQGLAAGKPDALAPVGVGRLPAGFPTNGVEWGLGQLPKEQGGKCFVVRGASGAVDWAPFPGATPLAHSHPLRPIDAEGGKTIPQVFAERKSGAHVLPSDSDIRIMAERKVPLHFVHTPFRHQQPDKVDNPSGELDKRPTVSFAIRNAKKAGKFMGGGAQKHSCQLTAEAAGKQFWSGAVESCDHPHLGDMLAIGALP